MRSLPFPYAVRNLFRSPLRLLLILGGSTLVVLLVLASTAFVTGMQQSLGVSGSADNVILLGSGSEESIERSQIAMRTATIASASIPGIRTRLGVPYVSPEIHQAMLVKLDPDEPEGRRSVIRGVTSAAFLVHPQVRIVEGRAPEPGRNELLAGSLAAAKLGLKPDDLASGSTLYIDDVPFVISGRFEAPQSVMDAELWCPLTDLQIIAQRDTLSCVILTLEGKGAGASEGTRGASSGGGGGFADVEAFAAQRLDLELAALPEREYYSKLALFFAPIRLMVIITAALIALGGVFGGLNTLYAAFAARVRELGTLQVLGYRRLAIVVCLLQESLLVNAAGALVASIIAILIFDGVAIRYSMGAFGLVVDGSVLAAGMLAGLLLGVVGAIPPAWRCLRLPIPEALKAA
ncbi:MAG: ABC transporter permease [Planctomycetota bacterium]|nr:ABC transporter permease [Planctomycetota bacterium]